MLSPLDGEYPVSFVYLLQRPNLENLSLPFCSLHAQAPFFKTPHLPFLMSLAFMVSAYLQREDLLIFFLPRAPQKQRRPTPLRMLFQVQVDFFLVLLRAIL